MSIVHCRVCARVLGEAGQLEKRLSAAFPGYATPSEHHLNPERVAWICGSHKERIYDRNWPDAVPYWYDDGHGR